MSKASIFSRIGVAAAPVFWKYKVQSTVASVNMYVSLPQDFKGTHMSRFIEVLNEHHGQINIHNFNQILEDLMKSLAAK